MPNGVSKPTFEDILTDEMRSKLGVSHRPNRPGGAFGVHKKPHRPWQTTREIPVETTGNAPPDSYNRRLQAEERIREERLAREQAEKALKEKEEERLRLETKLGHAALALREAQERAAQAEARAKAAIKAAAVVAEPEPPPEPEPEQQDATPEAAPEVATEAAPKTPEPEPERVKRKYTFRTKVPKSKPVLYDQPPRPSGRPKGFSQSTKTFDYSKFPSTERPWVFIDSAPPPAPVPAVQAAPAAKAAPPPLQPRPAPQPPPQPVSQPAVRDEDDQPPAPAWWSDAWREGPL